jgi:hypothetical protein
MVFTLTPKSAATCADDMMTENCSAELLEKAAAISPLLSGRCRVLTRESLRMTRTVGRGKVRRFPTGILSHPMK